MNLLKTLTLASSLALCVSVYADKAADKLAADTACKADGATAGCGAEQVGTGLLKCIHAYKKAHKEFKISDGCKTAQKALRSDRQAAKKP